MPRTKVPGSLTSSSRTATRKKVPSLESLAKSVKEQNESDDSESTSSEQEEYIPEGVESTVKRVKVKKPLPLTAASPKKLANLFAAAEQTVIITCGADGRPKQLPQISKSEAMKIFIRVRPFLPGEVSRQENKNLFEVLNDGKGIVLHPPPASALSRRLAVSQGGKVAYEFTHVLNDQMSQSDVFQRTMIQPIRDFLGGDSQLIFTYGVTNSGKTYTLLGPKGKEGILPRSLDRIFAALEGKINGKPLFHPDKFEDVYTLDENGHAEAMARRKEYHLDRLPKSSASRSDLSAPPTSSQASVASDRSDSGFSGLTADSHGFFDHRPVSAIEEELSMDKELVDPNASYEIWVSFMEIYEDMAYDLLVNTKSSGSARVTRSRTLRLCEEGHTSFVKGLVEVPVFSAAEAYHIMGLGRKNLHVASTKLNEASSRSHAIFTVKIVKVQANLASVTQLTFCDLAGTERANRTDNIGTRMKESQNINKDLHHLKECIEALKKNRGGKTKAVVPYRNCKLTRLFRSFFSGKGNASLILNISQCASDFDETVQAIRFGSSAMRIIIPMTKRQSILIQPPCFERDPFHTGITQKMLEMRVNDIASPISEESDDDDEGATYMDDQQTAIKKPANNSNKTFSKGKSTAKKTATKKGSSSSTAKKGSKPSSSLTATVTKAKDGTSKRTERDLSVDSTSSIDTASDGMSEGKNRRDLESPMYIATTDAEEEDEISEADLTLGGAVRSDVEIQDEFWAENCPFPEHVGVIDNRVRALLLLLGNCQQEITQLKAMSINNEMKVRKELCDFYEKERKKHAKEHAVAIRKLREEYEADVKRQLAYQKDLLEGKYNSRGDPSLMSFESNENMVLQEEMQEELEKLRKTVAAKDAEMEVMRARIAELQRQFEEAD